ncbi:peptidoglycan DD-metalloendopeptidase family protein [Deinococcus kurensis]|uniref:peptidoglycan DD-metalloendopeptidase family protein n=1 Tax=Deinococcus kurensis TaxID=2662757 RepID=UPI0012D2CE3F|nr:peptidoglycan DD-metalloendopeptidase family protein [Deinococcus kurensis]
MADQTFDVNVSFRDANNSLKKMMMDASRDLNQLDRITQAGAAKGAKLIDERFDFGKAGSTSALAYQKAVNALAEDVRAVTGIRERVGATLSRVDGALENVVAGKNSRDPDKLIAAVETASSQIGEEIDDIRSMRRAVDQSIKGTDARVQLLERAKQSGKTLSKPVMTRLLTQLSGKSDLDELAEEMAEARKIMKQAAARAAGQPVKDTDFEMTPAQIKQLSRALTGADPNDWNSVTMENDTLRDIAEGYAANRAQRLKDLRAELHRTEAAMDSFQKALDPGSPEMKELAGMVKNLGNHAAFKSGQNLNKLMPMLSAALSKVGVTGRSLENVFEHLHKSIDGTADLAVQVMQAQTVLGMASKRAKSLMEQGTRMQLTGPELASFVERGMMDFDIVDELTQKHVGESIRAGEDAAQMKSFKDAANVFGLDGNNQQVISALGESGLMNTIENFRGLMVNTWANMIAGIATEVIMNLGMVVAETYQQVGDLRKQLDQFPEPKNIEQLQETVFGAAAGFENGLQTASGFVKELKEMGASADVAVQVLEKLASASRTSGSDLEKTTQAYLTMVRATGNNTSVDVTRGIGVYAQNKINETLGAEKYTQLASAQEAATLSYEELIVLSAYYAKENLAVADSIQGVTRDLAAAKASIDDTEAPLKSAAEGAASLSAQWLLFLASLKNGDFDGLFKGMAVVASAFIKVLQFISDAFARLDEITGGWGSTITGLLGAVGTFAAIATGLSYLSSQAGEFKDTLHAIHNLLASQGRAAQAGAAGTVAALAAEEAQARRTQAAAAGSAAADMAAGAGSPARGAGMVAGAQLAGGVIAGATAGVKRGAWALATSLGRMAMAAIPYVNFILIGGTIVSMIWQAVKGESEKLKSEAEAEARAVQAEYEAQLQKQRDYDKGVSVMNEVLGGDWSAQNLAKYISGELDGRIKMLGLSVENVKGDFQGMVDAAKNLGSPMAGLVEDANQLAAQTSAAAEAFKAFQDARTKNNELKLSGGSQAFNALFEVDATQDAYAQLLDKINGTLVQLHSSSESGNELTGEGNKYALNTAQNTAVLAKKDPPKPAASERPGVTTGTRAGSAAPATTNRQADYQEALNTTANANFMQYVDGQAVGPLRLSAKYRDIMRLAKTKNVEEFTKLSPDAVIAALNTGAKEQAQLVSAAQSKIDRLRTQSGGRPNKQQEQQIAEFERQIAVAKAKQGEFNALLGKYNAILKQTVQPRADLLAKITDRKFDPLLAVQALAMNESTGGKNTTNDLTGASGPLQVMPGEAKRYADAAWKYAQDKGQTLTVMQAYRDQAKKANPNLNGPALEAAARQAQVLKDSRTQQMAFLEVMEEVKREAKKMGRSITATEAFARAQLKWYTGSAKWDKYKTEQDMYGPAAQQRYYTKKTSTGYMTVTEDKYAEMSPQKQRGFVRQKSDAEYLLTTQRYLDAGYGARSVTPPAPAPKQPAPSLGNADLYTLLGVAGFKKTFGFGATAKDGYMFGTHYGEDFATPQGTKLNSPFAGTATLKWEKNIGNYVDIVDALGNTLRLGHLSDATKKLFEGVKGETKAMKVAQGQLVGFSGNTGKMTTGAHLHVSTFKAGSQTRAGQESNPASVRFTGVTGTPPADARGYQRVQITPEQMQAVTDASTQTRLMNELGSANIGKLDSDYDLAKAARLRKLKQDKIDSSNAIIGKYKLDVKKYGDSEKLRKDAEKKIEAEKNKLELQAAKADQAALETYYQQRVALVLGVFKNSPTFSTMFGGKYKGRESELAKLFNTDVQQRVLDGRVEVASKGAKKLSDTKIEQSDYPRMLQKLLGVRDDQLRAKKVDPLTAALQNFQDELRADESLNIDDEHRQELDDFAERLKRVTGGVTALRKSVQTGLDERALLEPADRIGTSLSFLTGALKDQQDAYAHWRDEFSKADAGSLDREFARANMQAANSNADSIRDQMTQLRQEGERAIQQQIVSARAAARTVLADYRSVKAEMNSGGNEFVGVFLRYQQDVSKANTAFAELVKLSSAWGKNTATAATQAVSGMQSYVTYLQSVLGLTKQLLDTERQIRDTRAQNAETLLSRGIQSGDRNLVKGATGAALANSEFTKYVGGTPEGDALLAALRRINQTGEPESTFDQDVLSQLPGLLTAFTKATGPDSPLGQLARAKTVADGQGGFSVQNEKGEKVLPGDIAARITRLYGEVDAKRKKGETLQASERNFLDFMDNEGKDLAAQLAATTGETFSSVFQKLIDASAALAGESIRAQVLKAVPVNAPLMQAQDAQAGAQQTADSARTRAQNSQSGLADIARGLKGGNLVDAVTTARADQLAAAKAEVDALVAEKRVIEQTVSNSGDRQRRLAGVNARLSTAQQALGRILTSGDELTVQAIEQRAGTLEAELGQIDFDPATLNGQKLSQAPALLAKVRTLLQRGGELAQAAGTVQNTQLRTDALARVTAFNRGVTEKLGGLTSEAVDAVLSDADEQLAALDTQRATLTPEAYSARVDGILNTVAGLLNLVQSLPESQDKADLIKRLQGRMAGLNTRTLDAYADAALDEAGRAQTLATTDRQRFAAGEQMLSAKRLKEQALIKKTGQAGLPAADLLAAQQELAQVQTDIKQLTGSQGVLGKQLQIDSLLEGVSVTDRLTRALLAARSAYDAWVQSGMKDSAQLQQAMLDVLDVRRQLAEEQDAPVFGTEVYRAQVQQSRAMARAQADLATAMKLAGAGDNFDAAFLAEFGQQATDAERAFWGSAAATDALKQNIETLSLAAVRAEAERLNRVLSQMMDSVRSGLRDMVSIPRRMAEQQRQLETQLRGQQLDVGVNMVSQDEVNRELTRLRAKQASATSAAEYDSATRGIEQWEQQLVQLRIQYEGLQAQMRATRDDAQDWGDMMVQSLQGVLDKFSEMLEGMMANQLMVGLFGQSQDDGSGTPMDLLGAWKAMTGQAQTTGTFSPVANADGSLNVRVLSGMPGAGVGDLWGGDQGGLNLTPESVDSTFGVSYGKVLGEYGAASNDVVTEGLSSVTDAVTASGNKQAAGGLLGGGGLGSFDPMSMLLNMGLQIGMMALGSVLQKVANSGEKARGFTSGTDATRGTRNPNRVAVTINTSDEQVIRREADKAVTRGLRKVRYFD